MAIGYVKTIWSNLIAPSINAINLNKIEEGIFSSHEELDDIITGNTTVGKAAEADSLPIDFVYPPQLSPIGSVTIFAGSTIPYGWLDCDGSDQNRNGDFSSLYAVIGTIYGNGNGTSTFNIPDLRGQFVRGFADNNDVDPDGELRNIGSNQEDSNKDHYHFTVGEWGGYSTGPIAEGQAAPNWLNGVGYIGGPVANGNPEAESSTGKSSVPKYEDEEHKDADESRPVNVSMYYIIRAF